MSDAKLSTPKTIRAAAAQLSPDLEKAEGTLKKVLDAIDEAASKGVELIVFPETFVPYYPYFSFVYPPVASGKEHLRLYEEAVVVPSPLTDAVAERAKAQKIVVVLGVNERDHGSLYNAQLVFDADGTLCLNEQIEVTIRHHALESGCFVVNATGWLTDSQIESITADEKMQKALRDGCMSAIVSPEGSHLCEPLTEGEGLVIADLDMALITKRKRMMDSVGHYARPELLSLAINQEPTCVSHPMNATELSPLMADPNNIATFEE